MVELLMARCSRRVWALKVMFRGRGREPMRCKIMGVCRILKKKFISLVLKEKEESGRRARDRVTAIGFREWDF